MSSKVFRAILSDQSPGVVGNEIAFADPPETYHVILLVLSFISPETSGDDEREKLRQERGIHHCGEVIDAHRFAEKYECYGVLAAFPQYLDNTYTALSDTRLSALEVFVIACVVDLEELASKMMNEGTLRRGQTLACSWGELKGDKMIRMGITTRRMFEQLSPRYLFALSRSDTVDGSIRRREFVKALMEWDENP